MLIEDDSSTTASVEYSGATLESLLNSMSPVSAFMTKVAPHPLKCSFCNVDRVTSPFTATSTQHTVIKTNVVADSTLVKTVDDALSANFGLQGCPMFCGNSECVGYKITVYATAQHIKSFGPLMGILLQRTTNNNHPLVIPATLKLSCMENADVNNQSDQLVSNSLLVYTTTGTDVASHVQTVHQRLKDLERDPESTPHTVFCPRGCGEILLSTQRQCGTCFEALPQPPTSLHDDFTGEPGHHRCVGVVVYHNGAYRTLENRGRMGCTIWEYQGHTDPVPLRFNQAAKHIAEQGVYVLYERKDVLDYLEEIKTTKSARDESFHMAGPGLDVSVGEDGDEAVMVLSGDMDVMSVATVAQEFSQSTA